MQILLQDNELTPNLGTSMVFSNGNDCLSGIDQSAVPI